MGGRWDQVPKVKVKPWPAVGREAAPCNWYCGNLRACLISAARGLDLYLTFLPPPKIQCSSYMPRSLGICQMSEHSASWGSLFWPCNMALNEVPGVRRSEEGQQEHTGDVNQGEAHKETVKKTGEETFFWGNLIQYLKDCHIGKELGLFLPKLQESTVRWI